MNRKSVVWVRWQFSSRLLLKETSALELNTASIPENFQSMRKLNWTEIHLNIFDDRFLRREIVNKKLFPSRYDPFLFEHRRCPVHKPDFRRDRPKKETFSHITSTFTRRFTTFNDEQNVRSWLYVHLPQNIYCMSIRNSIVRSFHRILFTQRGKIRDVFRELSFHLQKSVTLFECCQIFLRKFKVYRDNLVCLWL